jgi:hypothetical protein
MNMFFDKNTITLEDIKKNDPIKTRYYKESKAAREKKLNIKNITNKLNKF